LQQSPTTHCRCFEDHHSSLHTKLLSLSTADLYIFLNLHLNSAQTTVPGSDTSHGRQSEKSPVHSRKTIQKMHNYRIITGLLSSRNYEQKGSANVRVKDNHIVHQNSHIDEKEIKDLWKEYMEKLMNEENELELKKNQ